MRHDVQSSIASTDQMNMSVHTGLHTDKLITHKLDLTTLQYESNCNKA